MENWKNNWTGTKKDFCAQMDYYITNILRKKLPYDLSDKDIRKLFLETICRNFIIAEIVEEMDYTLNDDEEELKNP